MPWLHHERGILVAGLQQPVGETLTDQIMWTAVPCPQPKHSSSHWQSRRCQGSTEQVAVGGQICREKVQTGQSHPHCRPKASSQRAQPYPGCTSRCRLSTCKAAQCQGCPRPFPWAGCTPLGIQMACASCFPARSVWPEHTADGERDSAVHHTQPRGQGLLKMRVYLPGQEAAADPTWTASCQC